MMDAASRLLQLIDFRGFSGSKKGDSIRTFYAEIGLSNALIKVGRGNRSENLSKISSKYPELNMDWIITGRGEMEYKEPQMIVGADSEAAKIAVDVLKEQVRELQADLIKCYKERDTERAAKEELIKEKEQLLREKEELIKEFSNIHLKKVAAGQVGK